MHAHHRFVGSEPHSLPTVEEIVSKALGHAHDYRGNNPYTAALGVLAELGVFDKNLREKVFGMLHKLLLTPAGPAKVAASGTVKTHASCTAEALEKIEEGRPVLFVFPGLN